MAGYGGIGMLSGLPMFQQQMGGGMFSGQRPMFPGASGGFVGAMNPGQQESADDYYARTQAMFAQQAALNEAKRRAKSDDQNTDRELSLKERLANHQMLQDQAAQGLARDRLGLDSNIASADANQRGNALSLQERLGLMGENRLSSADQQQHERAGHEIALRERLGMLPYQQQTADSVAANQMDQQRMAMEADQFNRPSGGQLLANSLGMRQLNQQNSQFDKGFGLDQQKLAQAERGMMLPYQQQTADSQADTLMDRLRLAQQNSQFDKGLSLDERKFGESQRQFDRGFSDLTAAQRANLGESQADRLMRKDEFGRTLDERIADRMQQQKQFEGVSGNNRFSMDTQERMHQGTLDQGQLHEENRLNLIPRSVDAQMKAEKEANAERNKLTNRNILLDFLGKLQNVPPEIHDRLMSEAEREFGGNTPMMSPQERATKQLFGNQLAEAQKAVGPPKTLQDVSKINRVAGTTLFEQYVNQKRPLKDILIDARKSDENSPHGAVSTEQTVLELLKAHDAKQKRQSEIGQQMLSQPRNVYVPPSSRFMR